jgi:hypothetical protein
MVVASEPRRSAQVSTSSKDRLVLKIQGEEEFVAIETRQN